MDSQAIVLDGQEQLFSKYPKDMDAYFANNEVIIPVLPQELLPELESVAQNFRVTSTKQYYEYLVSEMDFWNTNDSKNKLNSITQKGRLATAKTSFDNALNYYKSNNKTQGDNQLRQSINTIKLGCLYSKTSLAIYVLQFVGQHDNFIRGLKNGLLKDRTISLNTLTVRDIEGVKEALSYIEGNENDITALEVQSIALKEAIETANAHFAELNQEYTRAFHEQENRIASITNQTNEHLKKMDDEATQYYVERNKRCDDLEKLYDEKLKLQAPAQYWKDQETSYLISGRWWFAVSIILALVIVGGLVVLLASIPNMFSDESHWLDIFKNSAIITIITSVAIYILRITVKMAMSSFHLARDAKERHNLSYFYLALIQDKAITDKERALVINALFSRSDTGLLKNDSGPTMSNNVMDLVETVTKK